MTEAKVELNAMVPIKFVVFFPALRQGTHTNYDLNDYNTFTQSYKQSFRISAHQSTTND